jgi:hypothetical protein
VAIPQRRVDERTDCKGVLLVCFSGSNGGPVDPCSRQEIAADVSAVFVP